MHASMSFHSGAITGLNNVGMDQARPSCLDFLVSIQKLLIAPRPHSKTHNIESGHRPFSVCGCQDTVALLSFDHLGQLLAQLWAIVVTMHRDSVLHRRV